MKTQTRWNIAKDSKRDVYDNLGHEGYITCNYLIMYMCKLLDNAGTRSFSCRLLQELWESTKDCGILKPLMDAEISCKCLHGCVYYWEHGWIDRAHVGLCFGVWMRWLQYYGEGETYEWGMSLVHELLLHVREERETHVLCSPFMKRTWRLMLTCSHEFCPIHVFIYK